MAHRKAAGFQQIGALLRDQCLRVVIFRPEDTAHIWGMAV